MTQVLMRGMMHYSNKFQHRKNPIHTVILLIKNKINKGTYYFHSMQFLCSSLNQTLKFIVQTQNLFTA